MKNILVVKLSAIGDVIHVTSTKETLGGAANVAHNLALLGCQTGVAGFVGDDYHCQSLLDKFTARGIDYRGIIYTDAPTTTKLRVVGGHQQMLRLDFEETAPVAEPYASRYLNYIEQRINEGLDALIISDYAKGACTQETCCRIIDACHDYEERRLPFDAHLIHYPYKDWEHYISKLNRYTTLAAEKHKAEGKKAAFSDILLHPVGGFFKEYILKSGWRAGKIGFILAWCHFYYTLMKYVKIYYLDKSNAHIDEE